MKKTRYTKEQRNQIIEHIRSMREAGKDYVEMAEALNKTGFTTASGLPWKKTNVGGFVNCYRSLILKNRKTVPTETTQGVKKRTNDLVSGILVHPGLTDTQRVRMLQVYMAE
jgi:hypothetical protein